jgi:chorismate mutase
MDHHSASDSPTLSDLRNQIDALDHGILKMIAKRYECVMEVRERKDHIEDPNREEILRNRWKEEAKELGLSEEFALDLLERILAESKRLQSESS